MRRIIANCHIWAIILFLLTATAWSADKKNNSKGKNGDRKEAAEQSAKAARVLQEIMAAPDNAIPDGLLEGASCVAVFPSVIKGGFIVGARYGRGVVSCRTQNQGWSAPLFISIGGGSFGLQIGAQAADIVLLGMNPSTIDMFTKKRFELGGAASASAGPVGRSATATTDLPTIKSQFLSYSRSRGLFAGLSLEGSVIKDEEDLNKTVYASNFSSANILRTGTSGTPANIRAFTDALAKYAPDKKVTARK